MKMERYTKLDSLNYYVYSLGLYVNGFSMDRMDHYYYVQDNFGDLINVL